MSFDAKIILMLIKPDSSKRRSAMPLLKEAYTSDDYWSLPEGQRAELIRGKFYDMAPPSRIHQKLVSELTQLLGQFIKKHRGGCEVYPAPFAVNPDADDRNWVEPDISVICDPAKLTDRGCCGAPDLIVEIVSPGSRKKDYAIKSGLYLTSGVREYWIVDPEHRTTMVYFEHDEETPRMYPFSSEISCGIFEGLTIKMDDLLNL